MAHDDKGPLTRPDGTDGRDAAPEGLDGGLQAERKTDAKATTRGEPKNEEIERSNRGLRGAESSDPDLRRFSMRRLLAALADPEDQELQDAASLELNVYELCQANPLELQIGEAITPEHERQLRARIEVALGHPIEMIDEDLEEKARGWARILAAGARGLAEARERLARTGYELLRDQTTGIGYESQRPLSQGIDAAGVDNLAKAVRRSGISMHEMIPGSAPTATSEAAADHMVASGKASTRRQWVLDQVRKAGAGGLTNFELVDLFGGAPYQTGIQPRTTELQKLGKIRDSGRTRCRPGSNLGSIIWITTTPAEEAAHLERLAEEKKRTIARPHPGRFAWKAAREIREAQDAGPLFARDGNIARIVQRAIDQAAEAQRKGRR